MKIAAFVHYYVPCRNAGSETMLHTMLKRLVEDGHDVSVFTTDNPSVEHRYEFEGVMVRNEPNYVLAQQHIEELNPDVIVTHHQNTRRAARLSRRLGCPWVFVMHNDFDVAVNQLNLSPSLTVFNTRWIRNKHSYRLNGRQSMVLHPPIWADNHRTNPGSKVTLVNLNENKGSGLFYWLASNMPDVDFLGVVGGHGDQVIKELPNVEIVDHTSNMRRDVWQKTQVLLMPSIYESYGMAGVEAMASGIPVVAHPTPGLLESLSYGGTFIDRSDGQGWVDVIDSFTDKEIYDNKSALASRRSLELNPSEELDEWSERIRGLHGGSGTDGQP